MALIKISDTEAIDLDIIEKLEIFQDHFVYSTKNGQLISYPNNDGSKTIDEFMEKRMIRQL